MYCPICGSRTVVRVGNEHAPDSTGLAVMSLYPDNDFEGYDFEVDKYMCDRVMCGCVWYMKPPTKEKENL